MGYGFESKQTLLTLDSPTDAIKNTTKLIRILAPFTITRLLALVTVIADAAMTVTVTRRILVGSDTGAVAVGTLTVPDTTAAGKCVYKNITPMDLDVGDELKLVVSNTGTSTAFQLGVEGFPRPETAANQADLVASA